MLRNLIVLVVTLLSLFTVVAGVVLIGTLRLRASWADVGAPTPQSQRASRMNTSDPPVAAVPRRLKPLALDQETDSPEPATIELTAEQARLGGRARLEDRRDKAPDPPKKLEKADKKKDKHHRDDPRRTAVWITGWRTDKDTAQWSVRAPADGKYEIDLTYGCGDRAGGDFIVSIAGQDLPAHAQSTRNPEQFKVVTLATVSLTATPTTLTIHPTGKAREGPLMNLKEVKLIPAQ